MNKLLQINSTLNWGSTGRIVDEIGRAAINKGWESYIAYGRYSNETISQFFKIGKNKDVYNHVFQSRLFDNHGLASRNATEHFIEQIEKINPDVIHLHNIHGYYLNYSIFFDFLSKRDIPIIWTLHDCWSFTGHCAHYSYIGCQYWRTLCHNCPQKHDYPKSWFMDCSKSNHLKKQRAFTSVKNMTLVPVSEWLASEVRQSFLKKYPIRVISNGVDTDVFTPMQLKKTDLCIVDKFMILGVANVWSARKGLADFIALREKLSDDYVIVLIGLNERQIKKMPDGIIGIRRTNSMQDLAKYYSVADIYLNTSVEETFGLTTVESLSCGTPAIVYNSTACPEIVSSDTGFIVEPGDIEGIVDVINHIKNSKKKKQIQICRNFAVQQYDKQNKYMDYIRLYEDILK